MTAHEHTPSTRSVGWHYQQSRRRIDVLLRETGPEELSLPVPTCPGWTVRDVIAHLVGITEDAVAGALNGPPDEDQTRRQVERHRSDSVELMLDRWASLSELVAPVISDLELWPAAIDVVSHEHDVRGALGRPGARDHESVATLARLLADGYVGDPPISFDFGDVVAGAPQAPLTLRTTPFEVLRLRMGRRSGDQARRLDWSDDPPTDLSHLFVFGPATSDIAE